MVEVVAAIPQHSMSPQPLGGKRPWSEEQAGAARRRGGGGGGAAAAVPAGGAGARDLRHTTRSATTLLHYSRLLQAISVRELYYHDKRLTCRVACLCYAGDGARAAYTSAYFESFSRRMWFSFLSSSTSCLRPMFCKFRI